MAKDYYAVLGVSKTASQDEIKKAYRKLAHTHHPDKRGGDEARFKEINEAYSVVGDPEKRRQYDQFGASYGNGGFSGQGGQGFGGFDFSQFGGQGGFHFGGTNFEDLFNDMFTGGRSTERDEARGNDVQVDVEISFEEMVRGVKKDISLRTFVTCATCHGTGGKPGSKETSCAICQGQGQVRKQVRTILGVFTQLMPCDACHGRGKTYADKCQTCHGDGRTKDERKLAVNIPAGIENGQAVSLRHEGEAGVSGAKAGDLYVVVHVKPHPFLSRQGDHLFSEIAVGFSDLVLGTKADVPTLDKTVSMTIPAGTEPETVFRIRGGGIPRLGGFGSGDHMVRVKLRVPKKTNADMKRILEEWRALDRSE